MGAVGLGGVAASYQLVQKYFNMFNNQQRYTVGWQPNSSPGYKIKTRVWIGQAGRTMSRDYLELYVIMFMTLNLDCGGLLLFFGSISTDL